MQWALLSYLTQPVILTQLVMLRYLYSVKLSYNIDCEYLSIISGLET